MEWDYRDQLRRVDLGGGGAAFYVYDSSGQRVRKVCERAPGLTEERIYLAGFEVYRKRRGGAGTDARVGEAHLTLERESLHVMDDRSRIALVETRTLDPRAEDPAPARLIRYQVSNQINSSIVELDEHAQIISYEEYAPYGSSTYQAVRSRIETPKRYRFTGKERDEESGLYYHGARYFAPWLGRWTACDPGGFRDGPNLYIYTTCNPVNSSDPTGRHEEPGHGALIYRLALAAGWPEKDAGQIALASAGIDHDPAREPTTAPHILNGVTVQWHFLDKTQALNHVETDIKGGLKSEQSVTDFGEHLHTLADVGFKDAAGPHTRGNGPGILNIGVAIVLFVLLIAAAVVGALAIGFGGGGIAGGIFAGVVFGVHGVGDFFGLNELFAGAFGQGSFGHPWRETEHHSQSTPVSHVADELYQDPDANTKEFTKIYDLLEQGAKAKYGSGVVSNRKMATDAIAQAVNASTPEDILNVMADRGSTPSGQKVQKSYLEWVESESVTAPGRSPFSTVWHGEKVPWKLGDVDITVENDAYQISRNPNTQAYQIKKK
jgi:RHS repeat-associated protein